MNITLSIYSVARLTALWMREDPGKFIYKQLYLPEANRENLLFWSSPQLQISYHLSQSSIPPEAKA